VHADRLAVGHAYLAITEILALSDIWYLSDLQRFSPLRRAVETTLIAPGAGASGQAMTIGGAVWTTDLAAIFPAQVAVAAGAAGLTPRWRFP